MHIVLVGQMVAEKEAIDVWIGCWILVSSLLSPLSLLEQLDTVYSF